MCFSPQASFGAAAILSVLGVAALKQKPLSKISLIAAIPLVFGIQQALEGFVWIVLQRNDTTSLLYSFSVYGFLFFAAIWWPLYIPITLWYIESNSQNKKLLLYPIAAGVLVVAVASLNLALGGLYAEIIDHHIVYQSYTQFPYSNFLYYLGLLNYLIATAGALFISTIPHTWIMGLLVIGAFATAHLWYYYAFGSVWCFFAALCSALILFMF